jgi:hypothetical protein
MSLLLDYEDLSEVPAWKELSHARHVARKEHLCDTCGCPGGVLIGEQYEKVVALEDGKFIVVRMCGLRDSEGYQYRGVGVDMCPRKRMWVQEMDRLSVEAAKQFIEEEFSDHGVQTEQSAAKAA